MSATAPADGSELSSIARDVLLDFLGRAPAAGAHELGLDARGRLFFTRKRSIPRVLQRRPAG